MTSPLTVSRIVDRRELAAILGIGVATVDRMQIANRIGPRSIQISRGRRGWLRASVESWLASGEKLGRLPNQREWAEMSASSGNEVTR